MQYTVVHSKDPYLLARLATELEMLGLRHSVLNKGNPFIDGFEWLTIYPTYNYGIYNHNCIGHDERKFELTSRNYIKVLTQILS